jgi:hypothetical protein
MSAAPRLLGHKQWWIAVSLIGLFLAPVVLYFFLTTLNPPSAQPLSDQVGLLILFGAFAAIGALLVAYRPGNLVGWIFYAAGMGGVVSGFSTEYARYALLTNPGSLPFGHAFALLSNVGFVWAIVPLFTFMPLLFPNGRPPSPRWYWVGWLTLVGLLVLTISGSLVTTIRIGQGQWGYIVENPIGIASAKTTLSTTADGGFLLILISMLLSAVSVVLRYRRAAGQERAQIRWFAYAVTLVVGYIFFTEIFRVYLSDLFFVSVLVTLPVATALAIFKYRLFDIDLIIRRTMIYGALSLTLGLVFFGGVTLLQQLFGAVTGTEGSPAAIVISTLGIAALFTPLRRRIQHDIDRRFYRKKYNAEQTLAAFASTARDEVELESLAEALLAVVQETMQPGQISLWLRGKGK